MQQGVALAAGRSLSIGKMREIRRTLGNRQRATATRLRGLGAKIQYTYTDVFNGFRVTVKAKNVGRIARLPNVQAVLTVQRHTIDNTNTVPYIGADKTWGQTGRTGKGVKIAIIDTGINYYHLDFGGAGNAAWKADDPTTREPGTFPTAKVVGGYDFVGDNYDADTQPVPHPDPDPLDCKAKDSENVQHGTHVAGTAAGTGVTISGRTLHRLIRQQDPVQDGLPDRPRRGAAGQAAGVSRLWLRGLDDRHSSMPSSGPSRTARTSSTCRSASPFGDAGSLDAVASDNASLAGVVVVASPATRAPRRTDRKPCAWHRARSRSQRWMPRQYFPGATVDMATGRDIDAINANEQHAAGERQDPRLPG